VRSWPISGATATGIDLLVLRDLMGHASREATAGYATSSTTNTRPN
jgi:hypothetical protein